MLILKAKMKKAKAIDHIFYFALVSVLCFGIFAWQYKSTTDQCPRSGSLYFIVGFLSLIIFVVGKNISRMAKRNIEGWKVAAENILLSAILLTVGLITMLQLYFCLVF
jgi:uncharacterized membrane protein